MKKILALFALVLAVTLAFASCGYDDIEDTTTVESLETMTVASDNSGETAEGDSDTEGSDTLDTKPADTDNQNNNGNPDDTTDGPSWTKNY